MKKNQYNYRQVVDKFNKIIDKESAVLLKKEDTVYWLEKGDRYTKTKQKAIQIGKTFYDVDDLIFIKKYEIKRSYHKYGMYLGNLQWFKSSPETVKVNNLFYYNFKEVTDSFERLYTYGNYIYSTDNGQNRPGYNLFDLSLYGEKNNPSFPFVQKVYNNITNKKCKYSKFLKDYTFGVEFESSYGYVPENFCASNALLPVKDGSLPNNSLEYITPVMQGEVNTLKKQADIVKLFCDTDLNTSTHIHIGNLPQTQEFIVAFYMLYSRLQYEIQDISPLCKKDVDTISRKARVKDHCKFLPNLSLNYNYRIVKDNKIDPFNLKSAFTTIWTWANDGHMPNDKCNPNSRMHISDGKNKWNFNSRYSIVSLIPYFFEEKRTIEFRYLYGTTNSTRIINWLLICIAIIDYTKENELKILKQESKITLLDVIQSLKDKSMVSYLKEYIVNLNQEVTIDNLNNETCGLINRDRTKIKEWQ